MTVELQDINALYQISVEPANGVWTLDESYAFCSRLTHAHYENFPVGSMLIPKRLRPHVHAIYAFARISDDFSDEEHFAGQRMERLDEWDAMLRECAQGRAEHPVFIALANTIQEIALPVQWLRDLLHAFKMDVTVNRYEDFPAVMNYCRYSANPVGRMILFLFGYRDEGLCVYSDHICSGLQLANFWQDIAIDMKKDRVYIPEADMKKFGYSYEDLFNQEYNQAFQQTMRLQADRTWKLFEDGYPLLERVRFPLSAELRFTWLGGTQILARSHKSQYNVFRHRPKLSKWDFIQLGLRSFLPIRGRKNQLKTLFAHAQ